MQGQHLPGILQSALQNIAAYLHKQNKDLQKHSTDFKAFITGK